MAPLIQLILNFIIANWATISSLALTVLIGLVKRWADKNGIKNNIVTQINNSDAIPQKDKETLIQRILGQI